jgi:hypothetical protein
MFRSLALSFALLVLLPVGSPSAEPPGANALAPLPFGPGSPESTAVAVPGKIDLAPALGFS